MVRTFDDLEDEMNRVDPKDKRDTEMNISRHPNFSIKSSVFQESSDDEEVK